MLNSAQAVLGGEELNQTESATFTVLLSWAFFEGSILFVFYINKETLNTCFNRTLLNPEQNTFKQKS